jgi:hypothetical protein
MMNKTKLTLALVTALVGAGSAQNLVTLNPGFELGSPAGWYMWIDEHSRGNAVFETVEGGHTGAYALKMTVKTATREPWQIQMTLPKWDAQPNSRYRLTFWAKGPGPVRVNFTDATKNYAYITGFDTPLTSEWTKVTGEFNTADQSGSGAVGVAVGMGAKTGEYFLDDFSVEVVGPAVR